MASAAVQSIIDESECAVCMGNESLFQTMQVGLLLRILTALGVTMTQAEILAETSCYTCLGMSVPEAVTLVLLNEIDLAVGGGGGGGVSANLVGSGSPVGVVTPAQIGQFYSDSTNDVLWQALGATSADWHQWI